MFSTPPSYCFQKNRPRADAGISKALPLESLSEFGRSRRKLPSDEKWVAMWFFQVAMLFACWLAWIVRLAANDCVDEEKNNSRSVD